MKTGGPQRIRIPAWAFQTSLGICTRRSGFFKNQFVTEKLREAVRDDPQLVPYVEGVIGYIGDISACIMLGIDPKRRLRRMLLDTNLLTRRDEYDLTYRGWRTDVKTELVPRSFHSQILDRTISPESPYGCRLINKSQFEENSGTVDVYLWALLDNVDPRKAEFWYPVGFLTSKDAKAISPIPRLQLSATRKLHVPAYVFPTRMLRPVVEFVDFTQNPHGGEGDPDFEDKMTVDKLGYQRYSRMCKELGLESQ